MDRSSQCGGILSWLQGSPYKGWACKGKIEEQYSLRVTYWGYSRRHVFQDHEFGKPHVSPLLLYRLLDVSRGFLLMHQNLCVALSTWCLGPSCLERFTGKLWCFNASLHKDFPGQEVIPLCSHPFMLTLVLRHDLFSKLPCSWGKIWLGHTEALLGLAVPVILGSGLLLVVWRSPGVSTEVVRVFVVLSFKHLPSVKQIGKWCRGERGGVKDWKRGEKISFFWTLFR